MDIQGSGQLKKGEKKFRFEFILNKSNLFETYHGVYITTAYVIKVEVKRGLLSTNLVREVEFIVQNPTKQKIESIPANFNISPETLENIKGIKDLEEDNLNLNKKLTQFLLEFDRLEKQNFKILLEMENLNNRKRFDLFSFLDKFLLVDLQH